MPHRVCIESRCPNPARPGKARCVAHYREYERQRSARRREATAGVYKTKLWAMRRKAVLERDGHICKDGRVCGGNAIAEQVDHVVPLDDGGARYAMSNLRSTCTPCHEAKTAEENRNRRGGRERDAVA